MWISFWISVDCVDIRDSSIGSFQRKLNLFVPSHTGILDSGISADIFPSVEDATETSSLLRFWPLRAGGVALVFVLFVLSSSGIVAGVEDGRLEDGLYGLDTFGF